MIEYVLAVRVRQVQTVVSRNLYVQVSEDHSILKEMGVICIVMCPLASPDAVLGGDLEVPTLSGRVKLRIPQETQTGKLFRLRGKGVTPVRGGSAGDLMCRIVVETPVNLNKEQADLIRQLKSSLDSSGSKQSPRKSSWFEGLNPLMI